LRKTIVGISLAAALTLLPASSVRGASPRTRRITVYGFSILGEPMEQGIFPAFQKLWTQKTGEKVEFTGSFAGSGTIANQIVMGAPADIAIFAVELDAQRLVDAGATSPGSWKKLPHGGIVNRTPFVIFVRKGNPRKIHDYADLTQPGIRLIHPDPLTSGAANWAILAEYGAGQRAEPTSADAGYRMLLGVWKNVIAQAQSARAARTQFESGFGDALITYEQEALLDESRGVLKVDVVVPRRTVLSEHTVVLVDRNLRGDQRPLVEQFAAFLWSEAAQRIFVRYGFRSMDERLNAENPAFGKIAEPFLVEDYGGWNKVKADILDGVWKNRVLKQIHP
jgi:sulfate transport system substrate-binding protein